jgi:hypothetical protein
MLAIGPAVGDQPAALLERLEALDEGSSRLCGILRERRLRSRGHESQGRRSAPPKPAIPNPRAKPHCFSAVSVKAVADKDLPMGEGRR